MDKDQTNRRQRISIQHKVVRHSKIGFTVGSKKPRSMTIINYADKLIKHLL